MSKREAELRKFLEPGIWRRVLLAIHEKPEGIGFDELCRNARAEPAEVWDACDVAIRKQLISFGSESGYKIRKRGRRLMRRRESRETKTEAVELVS